MHAALLPVIASLPMAPGCYIFTNADQAVLYVGKSKHVRSRVRQYFQHSDSQPPKIKKLARLITGIEYVPAETEIDALILEYRLIKKYRPPFNAQMKKDGHPPYININLSYERPGFRIVFDPAEDGCCFGHFATTWSADEALSLMSDVWHTPLCGRAYFDGMASRGCLNRHLNKCMAPCDVSVDAAEYRRVVTEACEFLSGRNKRVLPALKKEMKRLSDAWDFEQAAKLRDQYRRLNSLSRRLKRTVALNTKKKICVFIKGYHEPDFLLLYVENGGVCLTLHYASFGDWPGESLNVFIEKILRKEWDGEPDAQYIAAAATIHACKHFVDISKARKAGTVLQKLSEAFQYFLELAARPNSTIRKTFS